MFLSPNQCIFCPVESDSFDHNVQHMTQKHSFFVPDIEYVTDLEGLFTYLGQKASVGMVCLWCEKQFQSYEACRDHMASLAHQKMKYEPDTVVEYDNYYDFTSTYPETEESTERVNEDGTKVTVSLHEMALAPGKFFGQEAPVLAENGYDLVLATGKTIGHRDLRVFYKQKLRPNREHSASLVSSLVQQYKLLGFGSYVSSKDIRTMRRDQQIAHKQNMKMGIIGNRVTRHHFKMRDGYAM